jgi:hypothetical protein
MTMEEQRVTRLERDREWLAMLARDWTQRVHRIIQVARMLDLLEILESSGCMHVGRRVVRRIDRFVGGTRSYPKAPVLLIRRVESDPNADQCVRERCDVVGVLVPALASPSRRIQKQHALKSQHVRTDQGFENIQYFRMEQASLGTR